MIDPIVVVGQLIGVAFACGLNLYATVLVVGIAARIGLVAELPPVLAGIQHPIVLGSAALLYAVEFVLDKVPHVDSLWDTIHTIIRPAAAAFLALGAAAGYPLEVQLGGAFLAGGFALAAHASKAGLRLAIRESRLNKYSSALSVVEDIAAVALVVSVLRFPTAAITTAAVSTTLALLAGPVLWRAFYTGLQALAARVRGFFGDRTWRGPDALPPDLRALIPATPPGLATPRATRASIRGLRGAGAFRSGWIVITPDRGLFVFRSLMGPRRVSLPTCHTARIRPGLWADVLELDAEDDTITVFLYKDGPPAAVALVDLAPSTESGTA